MRMTRLFSQTLRDAPGDGEAVASHTLLVRAGFIRQLASGIYSLLPLGLRTNALIEQIIRDEMDAIAGQEILMPVVHPADLWKESGRWYAIGSEMGRFVDKNGRDMVLAMTHEEVVADLVRREIRSYRQLPAMIYHLQTKWRDDPRPRAGLIRVREFTMKDSYSLDADWEGLDRQYRAHYQAYFNIFNRCAIKTLAVKADVGMMGGSMAHEYMYLTPIGEDTLVICDACGYAANQQIATIHKPTPPADHPLPLERIATPATSTIDDLAAFLGVTADQTAKAVFMVASISNGTETVTRPIFALVRGDMDVNETKLANAVKAKELRPAHPEEIRAIGAVPGYASPIGIHDAIVVVDDLVAATTNLISGANAEGYHYKNVNHGRDYTATIITDIAKADGGDQCPLCMAPLRTSNGIEVGNIFKLGTRFTEPAGASFLDHDGQLKPVIMGSYGIGVGRLLACIAEQHHDEKGLLWPVTVAPYPVHLVLLTGTDGTAKSMADTVYAELKAIGIECLYDDRDESPGVKFNDADLIGLPIRLTMSDRATKRGGIEFKLRSERDSTIIEPAHLASHITTALATLRAAITADVIEVPFED